LEQFYLKKRKLLITKIFDQNGFRHMSWILLEIYSGFLVALFLLGQFAALQLTANDEGDRGNDNNAAFALPSLGCLQSLLCEADYFLGRRVGRIVLVIPADCVFSCCLYVNIILLHIYPS
jgi:hypothetical protein